MLWPRIDTPIVIVMAEIPRLARQDRLTAAGAHSQTGVDLSRDTPTQKLMLPPVTAGSGLKTQRHFPTQRHSGREILTAAGYPLSRV
jgi:hypothetical protein